MKTLTTIAEVHALAFSREELIAAIKSSGVVGLGGAGSSGHGDVTRMLSSRVVEFPEHRGEAHLRHTYPSLPMEAILSASS